MAETLDVPRLRTLIEAGLGLLSELDPDEVQDRVLRTARDVTGAPYAALGVLEEPPPASRARRAAPGAAWARTRRSRRNSPRAVRSSPPDTDAGSVVASDPSGSAER